MDILAGGTAVISGLANPNEETLTLDPGTLSVAVAAAGTTAPVIGPADVTVAEGTHTVVYAWGSLDRQQPEAGRAEHRGTALRPGRCSRRPLRRR